MRSLSLTVIALLISYSLAGDLPPNFPRCNKDDAEFNACLLKATNAVREDLRKGVKSLGFPALNPFILPLVTLEQGAGSLNFKAIVTNATIRGLDNYVFKEFNFDPKTLKWNGQVTFETISLIGDCDFNGKILVAPLNGKGTITATTGPIEGVFEISGELKKRKNVEYYNPLNIDMNLSITGGKVNFENFSGENQDLVKVINQVISENGSELIKEVIGPIKEVTGNILKTGLGRITSKVPYNKLFPGSSN